MPRSRIAHTSIQLQQVPIDAPVGVYAHEKHGPQPLLIDLEIDATLSRVQRDKLEGTLDYTALCALVRDVANGKHRHLIEVLAIDLAEALIAFDRRIIRARVRVHKPRALPPPTQTSVFVELVRSSQGAARSGLRRRQKRA